MFLVSFASIPNKRMCFLCNEISTPSMMSIPSSFAFS